MKRSFKMILLVLLFVVPYIAISVLISDFIKTINSYDDKLINVLQKSYYLGCAEANHPDLHECKIKSLMVSQSFKEFK